MLGEASDAAADRSAASSAPVAAVAPVAPVAPKSLVLLGDPVAHSLSPRFQQAALDAAGLPLHYRAVATPRAHLAARLDALARVGAAGNVTIPLKEAVFDQCARHTAVARRVGAVNTFWHDEAGALVGHNTDVSGALVAMNAVLPPEGAVRTAPARVLLLGAGGAAGSVLVALAASRWAAEGLRPNVTICARTPDRAAALADRCGVAVRVLGWGDGERLSAAGEADLVINTTPIGLYDASQPVPVGALRPHTAVLDLVYRPGGTAWARAAKAQGHYAEDGLRMLVEQGAAAFEAWFGVPPAREAMWRALETRSAHPEQP